MAKVTFEFDTVEDNESLEHFHRARDYYELLCEMKNYFVEEKGETPAKTKFRNLVAEYRIGF